MLGTIVLELGDYGVIAGMLAAFVGVPGMFIVGLLRGVRKDYAQLEDRVRAVEASKVDKREWVRDALTTRAKMDRISEQITHVGGRLEAEFGIGAAVAQLANRLGERLKVNL